MQILVSYVSGSLNKNRHFLAKSQSIVKCPLGKKWVKMGETIRVEWVRMFLRSRLGIEAKILTCRKSDDIIVAKVENEGKKREIMINKNRLGKDKIFIENDVTWKERKLQKKTRKWVRDKKEQGLNVKAGYARVRINGVWKK